MLYIAVPPPPPPPVVGEVIAIAEWQGQPGLARAVRWPDAAVGTYRWGGEGALDLTHVELSSASKGSTIKRR